MRRSDHPNCPSAITCCFLSSLKTLLTLTQGNSRVRINVLDQTSVGRFSGDNHWPHLSDYRGLVYPLAPDHEIRALMIYGEWMTGEVVLKEDGQEPMSQEGCQALAGRASEAVRRWYGLRSER